MNKKVVQDQAWRWWRSMTDSHDALVKQGITPAPTKFRAELKRCSSVDDIVLTEGFRALWFSVLDEEKNERAMDMECLAVIAGVLVYVSEDHGKSLGFAAGNTASNKPAVSQQRMYKLLQVRTVSELLRQLRRLALQLGKTLPVKILVADIVQWFDEKNRPRPGRTDQRVVVRWAMDYFQAAGAAAKK